MVNTDYILWESQSNSVFKSKFLYACIMVFATTLFTGCKTTAENGTDDIDARHALMDIVEQETPIGDAIIYPDEIDRIEAHLEED